MLINSSLHHQQVPRRRTAATAIKYGLTAAGISQEIIAVTNGLGTGTLDANDTRERGVSLTHPAAAHGSVHHVNLAGLIRISPIAGLKNCYTRLQEGKVIAIRN